MKHIYILLLCQLHAAIGQQQIKVLNAASAGHVSLVEGSPLNITCKNLVNKQPIKWYTPRGVNLTDFKMVDGSTSSLLLERAARRFAGQYSCYFSNVTQEILQALDVAVKPELELYIEQSEGKVALFCNVGDTYPLPNITWSKDGVSLQMDNVTTLRYKMSETYQNSSQLEIYNMNERNAGNFTCFAENVQGSAEKSILVHASSQIGMEGVIAIIIVIIAIVVAGVIAGCILMLRKRTGNL